MSENIKVGHKYMFYSDNSDYILSLLSVLKEYTSDVLLCDGISLPYIMVNNIKLIYVNDVENIMTENYISRLRDEISINKDIFKDSSLFVLHHSRLDTLLTATTDLSELSKPFHPSSIETHLYELAKTKSKAIFFKEILDLKIKIINNEELSIFAYVSLYMAIVEDKIDFSSLSLFNDIDLEKDNDSKRIKNRLDHNQELYDDIETIIATSPLDIELNLKEFSSEFIEEYITIEEWENVPYSKIIEEIKRNKDETIIFDSLEILDSDIIPYIRNENTTKSGNRTKNIIIQTDQNKLILSFKFKGKGIKLDNFSILNNDKLKKE
ncbi:MAG: hypothetical protein HRT68_16555 [Flavobacteriaceae bacterium]|nr:hypothetical protein [Flavobacteriaceae bacterium]